MVMNNLDRQLDLATKLGNGTYSTSGLVTLDGAASVIQLGNARTQFDVVVDVTAVTGGTGDFHNLYIWGTSPVAPLFLFTLGSMTFNGLFGAGSIGRTIGRHVLRLDNLAWNNPASIDDFTTGPLPQIQAYIEVAAGRSITFDAWIVKSHQQV